MREALEAVDGPTDTEPDFVPTADQSIPLATYPDWVPGETRIIQCRIGNDLYSGDRYESRDEARAATELKYGKVLEANYTPGRAFFRVRRTNA